MADKLPTVSPAVIRRTSRPAASSKRAVRTRTGPAKLIVSVAGLGKTLIPSSAEAEVVATGHGARTVISTVSGTTPGDGNHLEEVVAVVAHHGAVTKLAEGVGGIGHQISHDHKGGVRTVGREGDVRRRVDGQEDARLYAVAGGVSVYVRLVVFQNVEEFQGGDRVGGAVRAVFQGLGGGDGRE